MHANKSAPHNPRTVVTSTALENCARVRVAVSGVRGQAGIDGCAPGVREQEEYRKAGEGDCGGSASHQHATRTAQQCGTACCRWVKLDKGIPGVLGSLTLSLVMIVG